MATIGQVLTAPETGWKRYKYTDSNFSYTDGTWTVDSTYDAIWTTPTGKIKFNFTGAKLRFLGNNYPTHTNSVNIYIDGVMVTTFSEVSSSRLSYVLACDIQNLSNKEHYVVIENTNDVAYTFQAIDIDEAGELKPYAPIAAPINLVATAGDSQVSLSWTAVDGATGYNVKRSTTAGGPYTTIVSNVSGTSYVDTSVTNGTTYYYVVTAVNSAGESNNSNEASAKPEGIELLRVTMLDSSERDYQLSTTEIDGFVNWFNSHTSANTTSYMLNKKVGTQNSKEYLAFDKIISFEVMELK